MTKTTLIALIAAFALMACTPEGTYPGSGEACSDADPVMDLDASDCTPPVPASAGAF